MAAEINRRTLTDLLKTDYIFQYINNEDSAGNKVHLSYNKESKWGIAHLSTLERIAKILPSCFLRLFGLGYIADTKIDHLFAHRSDYLGNLDNPADKNLIGRINTLFISIWENKKNERLEEFFAPPPPSAEDIQAGLKRTNAFLNEFEKFIDELEGLDADKLTELMRLVDRLSGEEADLDRFKKHITPACKDDWNITDGGLGRIKSKLVVALSTEKVKPILNELIVEMDLKGQIPVRRALEYVGVALELPPINIDQYNEPIRANEEDDSTSAIPGISNRGNDCYLISAIQSLLASQKFQTMVEGVELKKWKNETKLQFQNRTKILATLKGIMTIYNSTEERAQKKKLLTQELNTLRILILSNKVGVDFIKGNRQQQDSFDVFRVIFNVLDLNDFELEKTIHYGTKKSKTKKEDFKWLDVEINGGSITDSIEAFFSREKMEDPYLADDNKRYKDSEQQYQFKTAPDLIPLHLKRFRYDYDKETEEGTSSKNQTELKVDEIIDMSPYVKNKAEGERCLYRVRSVVTHLGSSLGGGHYVADVKMGEHWHHLNDSVTTLLEDGQVNVAGGYVLILEKLGGDEVIENAVIGKPSGTKAAKASTGAKAVSQKAPVGLLKGENMDYLNVLVQALFSMDSVGKLMNTKTAEDADPNRQVVKAALKQLYKAYHDPKKKDDERLEVMQNFRKALFDAELFENETEQQDLHEILSQFLVILDNGAITKTTGKAKKKTSVESHVVELPALDSGKSLVSAMEEYLKDVKTLPRVLPVVRQKEGDALDVSTKQTLEVSYGEHQKMNYKLKSFIIQQANGSRYISYVRRGDQWYSIDNLTAKKIGEDKLKRAANSAAIFFYESN